MIKEDVFVWQFCFHVILTACFLHAYLSSGDPSHAGCVCINKHARLLADSFPDGTRSQMQ
jgi:hypothetical protein